MIETLNTRDAASLLAAKLGDTPEHWLDRLANERRPARQLAVKHALPCIKAGGRFQYPRAALDAWIDAEAVRRANAGHVPLSRVAEVVEAFGLTAPGQPAYGRPFRGEWVFARDEQAGDRFVQLHVGDPWRVYALPIKQFRSIAREIAEMIAALNRWEAEDQARTTGN